MAAEAETRGSLVGGTLPHGTATKEEVAVTAFAPLLRLLETVPDPRRAEGKVYRLPHVLLFSILAIVSGGNSYRSVTTFIDTHRRHLNRAFGLRWRRAPAHTSICNILQGLDSRAVEAAFRRHASLLQAACAKPGRGVWRSTARPCAAASTSSATAPLRNCSACSPPTPRWCWRTAISTRNRTRSRPLRRYSPNSAWRVTWSRSTPCTDRENP